MAKRDGADNVRENHVLAIDDRRDSPRFSCGGHATISRLPSDGIILPGKIRDLSLGGCCVETTSPIAPGVRAELVLRVNAASFRAVGEVRAIRGHSGACLEFVLLSAGGKGVLADLITELARLQAVMNDIRTTRREIDPESFRRQLDYRRLQATRLSRRFPLLGTTLPPESSGGSSGVSPESDDAASTGKDPGEEERLLVGPVDLFG
ncbi:MAG: PilZ domain-containing protein [Acidobacteriia bacterium]|nr:PilZ domain-containing protein [Terriglobia bacterium]